MTVYVSDKSAYKRGKCEVCGKTAERQKVFTVKRDTLHWFEAHNEVTAMAEAWMARPVRHKRCETES
jgi:hypothetical protein